MTITNHDRPSFPINPLDGLTPGRLRTLQIIAGALLLGVLTFLGIVLFLVHVQNKGQGVNVRQDLPILSFVAVAMLAMSGPMSFLLPALMTRTMLGQILTGKWAVSQNVSTSMNATTGAKLFAVRQSTMIVAMALLEGTAFMGCIAYLLEANPLALAVTAVAVFLMLIKFPTESRVRAWLEQQATVLTEMHQQAAVSGKW